MGSHTTLRLEKGATLLGSPDAEDYPLIQVRWEGRLREGHRALIHASNATEIAIVGARLHRGQRRPGQSLRSPRGPCLIEPVECKEVLLEGFSTKFVAPLVHPPRLLRRRRRARNLTIRSTAQQRRRH